MPDQPRAAIYSRISQDREGAGLGIERQREDCERLATTRGLSVIANYSDNDVSAYNGRERPGYRQLLDAIRGGQVDVVLAWHEDRLHRSPRELEDYIDACAPRKVPTYFAQAGELELATASGRMTARIRGAVARQESEHKAERVRRAQLQKSHKGEWLGGVSRPFGWDVHGKAVTVNEPEAQQVRWAVRHLLAGGSLGSIVTEWNRHGVATVLGNQWNYATARQVLTRDRNYGALTYGGEVVSTGQWPAILTEDEHFAVVALLADPSRRKSSSNAVRHLLAGIALCGVCGASVRSASVADRRGGTRTVYRCRRRGGGVNHAARDATALDQFITEVVVGVLSRPDWVQAWRAAIPADEGPSAGQRLAALRVRLDELTDAFTEGEITRSQLTRGTARLREEITRAEADLTAGSARTATAQLVAEPDVGGSWDALDIDRKRTVIRELMTVTILPGPRGKGFDPAFVRVEWR